MIPAVILSILVAQILFGGFGLFVYLRHRKNTNGSTTAEARLMTHVKSDETRCQQLLTDINGTLDSHNTILQEFQDASSVLARLSNLDQAQSDLGRQLNAQVDELGELLENYDDAMRHERLKLKDYAQQADDVDELINQLAENTEEGTEPLSEIVRTMLDENRQLRATVQNCQTQISELIVRAIRSDRDARVDPLTKLPNRRAWAERSETLAEEAEFALAVMDLDNFKQINDHHGHSAGDAILMMVARVLREDVHCSAFRTGGDEFILVVRGAKIEDAKRRIDSIRRRIENAVVTYQQDRLTITVTLGLACARDGEAVSTILERADSALYRAKTSGKNCFAICEQNETAIEG